MDDAFDVDQYIALIHSSPPELLAAQLVELLDDPAGRLERLKVYVPEVCSIVCARIVARDHGLLERIVTALGAPLAGLQLDFSAPDAFGASLARDTACSVAYYLGRLQSLLVMAAQVPLIDVPPMVKAEALDGSDNQAILFLLAQRGPMSIRTLRLALNGVAKGPVRSLEHVRKCLVRLIHIGAVETEHRSSQVIYYRLSDFGSHLLEEQPEWMDLVVETYRSYRTGSAPPVRPHAELLLQRFREIDGESSG